MSRNAVIDRRVCKKCGWLPGCTQYGIEPTDHASGDSSHAGSDRNRGYRRNLKTGAYPCVLDKESKAYKLYGTEEISERHRHRYEVNNDYRDVLEKNGMMLSGLSPDKRIVEMIEIPEHPWFIATQAHPELKSRPNRPHPLFKGFVEASLKHKEER